MANRRPTNITLSGTTISSGVAGFDIGALTTLDPDAGNSFTYSVADARFQVVDGELMLKPGVLLDFATTRSVRLAVTSTDQGGLSVTKTLALTVAANHAPTGVTLAQNPVYSGAAGADVGTLGTQDADAGNTFTYSVTDARFQIVNGNELVLKPGVALNYNTTPSVSVAVTSTDQSGASVTKTLVVPVGGLKLNTTTLVTGAWYTGPMSEGQTGVAGGSANADWTQAALIATNTDDQISIGSQASGGQGGAGGQGHDAGGLATLDFTVGAGGTGGVGGNATARVHDTTFALGIGNDHLTLSAWASGGMGGSGGGGGSALYIPGTLAKGGTAGSGGHGGESNALIDHINITSSGALVLFLKSGAIGDGHHGAWHGSLVNGGDAGWPGFGKIQGRTWGNEGDGGDAGSASAKISNVSIKANFADLLFRVTAHGGDGGSDPAQGITDETVGAHGGHGGNATAIFSSNIISTGAGSDIINIDFDLSAGHGGTSLIVGQDGFEQLTIQGNIISLGAGDDFIGISIYMDSYPYSLLSATNFKFFGNVFDGGSGNDTLDLYGVRGASAKFDLAGGKLYIGDSIGNTLKNFDTIVGTYAGFDTYIDARGNGTYWNTGSSSFTFARGHGADVIYNFYPDDFLTLKGFGAALNTFAKLKAHTTDVPGGIHIDTADGGSLDLYGITKAQLQADHVFFA